MLIDVDNYMDEGALKHEDPSLVFETGYRPELFLRISTNNSYAKTCYSNGITSKLTHFVNHIAVLLQIH